MDNLLTVSEITGKVKFLLEEKFKSISVIGEISNFKSHFSGHWYFTLKDSDAQISCVMWKGLNSHVFFTPKDGMKIIVNGKLSLYPPRGNYQIDVRSMKPAGVGELQAAFEELKRRLSDEGLFDKEYKKPIPQFPQKIGIVTAIDGAALQDMRSVASRRYPLAELVIASSRVQGEGAAEDIVKNVNNLNKFEDVDVIIVGRGGGSLEDLWAFNEEKVARAIFESKIPVVSGVGHEIDFTISDFVADLRAPTPSVAMELVTPDQDELFAFISEFSYNSQEKILNILSGHRRNIGQIIKSYGFRIPQGLINNKIQLLDNFVYRIQNSIENKLSFHENNITFLRKHIESYNVKKILKKGYTIIKQDSNYITHSENLNREASFNIQFFDNEIEIKRNGKKES